MCGACARPTVRSSCRAVQHAAAGSVYREPSGGGESHPHRHHRPSSCANGGPRRGVELLRRQLLTFTLACDFELMPNSCPVVDGGTPDDPLNLSARRLCRASDRP